MKKYLIIAAVALVATASAANAQSYTFSNDLQVGSRGPDVIQLQTWLMSNGFSIPAIASNPSLKGYFGAQTQSALAAYQRSINLPAYGFFGPMTRAYLNRGGNPLPGALSVAITNAPASLGVGQTGTWTILATGGQSTTNLSYSVIWGDENVFAGVQAQSPAIQQNNQITTFTHAYSNSGIYNVTFTVRDNARGVTATKSAQVTVGSVASNLQITTPNGGESWQKGTTQYIGWTGTAVNSNQTADIRLEFPRPTCAQPGQLIVCMALQRAPYLIAKGVNLSARSYAWNVGSVSDLSGSNATIAADGQYKIQICPTNSSDCDDSDSNFTIYSGTNNNQQPVINGVDAPVSLSINEVGKWTIRATDPQNSQLSYSVLWGDEPGYATTGGTTASPISSQSAVFSHSYANSGVYMVTFTVRNGYGAMVQTSASVNVTGSNQAGPLRVTSPNGGEIWQKGTTHAITWTSPYYFAAAYADLKVTQKCNCTSQICPAIAYAPYTIATNIPINQNSYSWNVGYATGYSGGGVQTLPDGQYTVQLCQTGTDICASSDAPFTIMSGSVSGLADVNIVSPNGGDIWQIGTNQNVTVNVTGDLGQRQTSVNAYLVSQSNTSQQYSLGTISNIYAIGQKSLSVFVPYVNPGSYKVYVTLSYIPSTGTCPSGYTGCAAQPVVEAYDYSDYAVTVQQTGPYVIPPSGSMSCPIGYVCTPNR